MGRVTDTRPVHQRIAADLRAKIMDGTVAGKLPSVSALKASYDNAANATIQHAIKTLRSEDLIYTRHGQGIYVRDKPPIAVRAAAYIAPGEDISYRLLGVEAVSPPVDVAHALPEGERKNVILRKRLMVVDQEPMEISWSYYPQSISSAAGLDSPKRIRRGVESALANAGFPQRMMTDRITSRPPTTEELELLELPDGVSVLRTFRVITSDDDRVVEVTVMIKGVHRAQLEYRQAVV